MIGNISRVYAQKDQASAVAYAPSIVSNDYKKINESKTQEINKENTRSARVTISEEALKQLGLVKKSPGSENTPLSSGQTKLSSEELKQISDLKSRDQEVRSHELAHVMVGGNLVRKGANYQYQTGPDGQRYAVGGEVSIDSSSVDGDPTATINKMEHVKRTAMAPADPSAADRAVASSAAQIEAAARMELMQENTHEAESS
ncbi:MAG: hypothetical protein C0410_07810 [Anaerolinea sp.]|nr:hypothetical protein [Anaerolinea sp.]